MARLFGTNGIRWVIGSTAPDFPVRLGVDAGHFFGRGCRIAVGYDTRSSSTMIFNAVVSGLMSCGCDVVELGLVPTPVVQFAVNRMKLGGGLVVTASHNPPEFNGLKFIASDGTEISKSGEEEVERIHFHDRPEGVAWDSVGKCIIESKIQSTYRDSILSHIKIERKLRVVVDCANGAATEYTPDIMAKAGSTVLTLNAQPDGRFPGRMPEPVRENVGMLMSTVKAQDADMGIAHDGDADRATFVDEQGNYVTGNQSLAIFAEDALARMKERYVVVPINTSRMVEDVVIANGGRIEYTAVGSPLIARRMMEIDAAFGGEGNGGAIFPEHLLCRDGMMAAARMLEIVSRNGPLSGLVAELPKYHIRSEKLRIPPEHKEAIIQKVKELADGQVSEIDGIKTDIDGGWALVRASGTEPIIRITVETMSEESCNRALAEKVGLLKDIIRDLS